LSTIQKADIIYVLDQGVVYYTYLMTETDFSAESGTHDELYALKGRYFEMVQAQALEATE
jgi:ATP-binding cassette subfamily B (MDR/TAP) protein 1